MRNGTALDALSGPRGPETRMHGLERAGWAQHRPGCLNVRSGTTLDVLSVRGCRDKGLRMVLDTLGVVWSPQGRRDEGSSSGRAQRRAEFMG